MKIILDHRFIPKNLTRNMIDPKLMQALDDIAKADQKAGSLRMSDGRGEGK